MSKKIKQPAQKNYGMRRLLGMLLMLFSSAAIYACLNDVSHGILVFFKEGLTKYLGEYRVFVPIILLLIGIKVFFDARIGASKNEVKEAAKLPEKEETPVVKTKVLSKPRVTPKPEPKVKTKAVEPKEIKRSVYDQEEFEEFTEGIRKTSTFRRILNYNSSKAYESEEAKVKFLNFDLERGEGK